ncbi:7-cyano-7-deazaguanine synthase QueC [Fusobacterium sp.]|uniref:7-cyano-7-deazaguanine synthase QueC n=1 Tax=Fusobacterium sp. TaxID=68766 RepID=UPI002637CD73|nr:7-cyano-7-deazaguanine synthase QueC [Fusobacterium sp.]
MKILVLLSGGVDSSTCLALAVNKYGNENVVALSSYYGQKHTKELESARKIANYYKVELIEMNLAKIFAYSNCSLLSHSGKDIPQGTYDEQLKNSDSEVISTYVPFRNGLFLSTAASIALSKDCDIIYYGAHSDDVAGNAYPDCSFEFNESMNLAIWLGSGKKVKIEAPFVGLHKSDIVKKGLELNLPYELTWSCYEGEEYSCGKCATCIDREKAFLINNSVDPLVKIRENK